MPLSQQFKAKRANVHTNPGGFKRLLCVLHKAKQARRPATLLGQNQRDRFAQTRQLARLRRGRLTMSQPHHMRSVRPVDFHNVPKVAKPRMRSALRRR